MFAHPGLQVEEVPGGFHISADLEDQRQLEDLLALAEECNGERWFLDCGGASPISAELLGMLLRLDKALRSVGGRLSLRNLSPLAYEVFHVCRLTGVLDVCPAVA